MRFYRVILVDTGNNMRAENWLAAADAADLLVVTSTVREDTGYSGLWMLDALQDAGYQNLKYKTVTVLSDPSPTVDAKLAADLVDVYQQRTRGVYRVPYDPALVAGSVLPYAQLSRGHPDVVAAGLRGNGLRPLVAGPSMRAVVYRETGPSSVLQLVDREVPEPGPGEVRVRLVRAGVNPTDWKFRAGTMRGFDEVTPGHDGAGLVDAVGDGVTTLAAGDRVWLVLAQHGRAYGTAAEYTVQPAGLVVRLPDEASYDLGASLGVPAVTAHRALTSADGGPARLGAGAMDGMTVLVQGGAGAVGNAAIQLARWSGATVVTTVSSAEKADAGQRRGGAPRRGLHPGRHRGRDPGRGSGRRRPGGRGGPGAEQRARHRGDQGARDDRHLRQQRRRRADRAVARDVLAEPALPVPDPLHPRRAVRPRRDRGRHRSGARRVRCASARTPACRCTTTRSRTPRPRTTRSRAARSARCSSTSRTPDGPVAQSRAAFTSRHGPRLTADWGCTAT